MSTTKLPERIPGLDESIYAGFWIRLGAGLLDVLVIIPFIGLAIYMQTVSQQMLYLSQILGLAIGIALNVYMVKVYGATPGKLMAGIKIVKLDGAAAGWEEAIMRYLVDFILAIAGGVVTYMAVSQIAPDEYISLGFVERSLAIQSKEPELLKIHSWAMYIWIFSEFIILLTNKRRKALHDFIAETVVIKTKLIPRINIWQEENS